MTAREMMIALAEGKKIGNKVWSDKEYIHLDENNGPINRFGAQVFIWSSDDFYIMEDPIECWLNIPTTGIGFKTKEEAEEFCSTYSYSGLRTVLMREVKDD